MKENVRQQKPKLSFDRGRGLVLVTFGPGLGFMVFRV